MKMPVFQAAARAKAKDRAIKRAKERAEEDKLVHSATSSSEDAAPAKKSAAAPRGRSKTVGAGGTKTKKETTKVALKKKDETVKKGSRTLHDYFSMDTSNSGSASPKKAPPKKKISISDSESEKPKKPLSKSQVVKPVTKKEDTSSEGDVSIDSMSEDDKTEKSAPSKTEKSVASKTSKTDLTEKSDSDYEDSALSDMTDESDIPTPKGKPATRGKSNTKKAVYTVVDSESDD